MWHDGHAEIAIRKLGERLPACRVEIPHIGQSYALFEKEEM